MHRTLAVLVTLSAAAAFLPGSAKAAASMPLAARRSVATTAPARGGAGMAASMSASRRGTLIGSVIDGHGQALVGVCVTASPATGPGWPAATSRTVLTSTGGMFTITDLPPGLYRLRYRRCFPSGATMIGSPAAGLVPGVLIASITASRGYVTSGRVTTLGSVTVRPRTARQPAGMLAMPMRPTLTRLTARAVSAGSCGQAE